MKTVTIFIIAIILSCVDVSFAQFGKIKIKKPKIAKGLKTGSSNSKTTSESTTTSTTTSSATTSSSNTGRTSEGAPTRRSGLSSYETYSKVRDNIKYARGVMEEASWKMSPDEEIQGRILKYLNKAKENLDLLKQDSEEKDQVYLKQFNEEYLVLKKQCTDDLKNYADKSKLSKKLEEYSRWVSLGPDYHNDDFEPSYKKYYKFIEEYKSENPTDFNNASTQRKVSTVNAFFEVDVYEKVTGLDKKVTALINNTHRLNSDKEESYLLNADNYLKKFEAPIKLLGEYKRFLLKDHTSANALELKINKEKSMLEEYISSGKLAAHQAKYAQEIIDGRRLRKGMSDSKIESFAKDKIANKYGTILRVSVASENWYVNKNAYIPLNKNIEVDFATKKEDGKCYYVGGVIRRDYEGGGTYGSWYLTSIGTIGEMNCNNINK